jgi:hypothetical protein
MVESKTEGLLPETQGLYKDDVVSAIDRQARTAREKTDTYQWRNILIYYCVFMIPIPIIPIPRIY